LLKTTTPGHSECAWCSACLNDTFVCLPGLKLLLCPECAIHVGKRLEEEGADAQLMQLAGLVPAAGERGA